MDRQIQLDFPYRIGREVVRPDGSLNDIVLAADEVSVQHACITCISEQVFLLEDEGSTNGTFVNDHQIIRKVCGRTDFIRLAGQSLPLDELFPVAHVQQAMQARYGIPAPAPPASRSPHDFTAEFRELKACYETYQESKARLRRKQHAGLLIKQMPGAVMGVLGWCFHDGHPLLATLTLGGSGLASIVGVLLSNVLSPTEQLDALEEWYKATYACPNPKCRLPLTQHPWANLASRTHCLVCKAIWNNEVL